MSRRGALFAAVQEASGKMTAEGDVTCVCVDDKFEATPVPTRLRKALEKHLQPVPDL